MHFWLAERSSIHIYESAAMAICLIAGRGLDWPVAACAVCGAPLEIRKEARFDSVPLALSSLRRRSRTLADRFGFFVPGISLFTQICDSWPCAKMQRFLDV